MRLTNRGFALIAAIILIVVAAAMAVILATLVSSSTQSGAMHIGSAQSLFAAEAGLERAAYGYKSGTACGSLTFSSSVGQGAYTTTGTLFNPGTPTTLSAAIGAADTVIPVNSIAGYASHGRIRIGSEEIDYAGISGNNFTGARRGVVGSPAQAHALGAAVEQNQCLLRAVGTADTTQRTLEGATTIKRVQSGTIAMNPATQTVTLTAVDTARSFVLCHNRTNDGDPVLRVTCVLTNATTLTITSSQNNASNVVQWYVVEYTSGIAVQRGSASFANGTGTVNVALSPAVNLAKSFVLISERISDNNQNRDERWTIRARLSTTTNLELSRNETGTAVSIAWQVIQMQDASVQSGLTTINNGSATATAAITAVDTAKTFVVFTRRAAAVTAGRDGRYQVRGELTNATTLTFTRSGTSDVLEIAWFAVTLNDGTTVQRGVSTAAAGATQVDASLSPAIVLNRSFPIISVSGGENNNNGRLDDTSLTDAFTSTTNLRLQRVNTAVSTSAAWFVVHLGSPRIDWKELFP